MLGLLALTDLTGLAALLSFSRPEAAVFCPFVLPATANGDQDGG
jgi:hypothetical protein